jgi:hypothetical protein
MGLFGGSSTTFVSSSIYNMAGDVNKRPNFLSSTIAAAAMGDTGESMGDSIREAYKNGPGSTLRSFARWAAGSSGYDDTIGLVSGSLVTGDSLDNNALAEQIRVSVGAPAGYTAAIQSSEIGYGDISWWAERRILATHPTLVHTNWHCDYVDGQAVITYADGTKETFTPTGFSPDTRFLFAAYTLNAGEVAGAVVQGAQVNLNATAAFPDSTGWTLVSNTMTPVTLTLSSTTVQGMNTNTVFQKTTYNGIDPVNPARTHSTRQTMTMVQTMTVSGGNPVTTRWYRIDTQDITNASQGGLQVFIYPLGSGNAVLDAMFNPPANMGTFFPYIPVRIDNKMVSDTYQPEVYSMAKRAYKRATGKRFDDLIDKINDNESIGDIDYAYVVFGVSANVAEVSAKKYIWAFFQSIMDSASFSRHAYTQFKTKWAEAQASQQDYADWVAGGGTGGAAPVVIPFPPLPIQSIEIKTSNTSSLNFDMLISWNGVESSFGTGLVDPAHKVGDIWWKINGADTFSQTISTTQDPTVLPFVTSHQVPNVTLYWQVDENNWKALTLYGLKHQNFIYNGKSVDISITDAINDTEESGFIIPLNAEIYKSMSLTDATQMATACVYLVFNCYQVVKQKWYQTGLFQIVMIIIIIVITVLSWGTATGPATAAYGAIGAAIGLTGTAAIIAGFVISMIAAMILMKLIGIAAKAAFGDKVGAIVSAVASIVMIVYGAGVANGGGFAEGVSQLTSPQNLLAITNAVGDGIVQYQQAEISDIAQQTQDMLGQYNTQMKAVADKYADTFGSGVTLIDPLAVTEASTSSHAMVIEPPSAFLNRTLMTGSDIAELNSTLISEFTSLTLDINQNLAT